MVSKTDKDAEREISERSLPIQNVKNPLMLETNTTTDYLFSASTLAYLGESRDRYKFKKL
jgi:hypothetical protein